MKQGSTPTIMDGAKREPRAHAISPKAVAEIGVQQVRMKSEPLYRGRGFEAPKADSSIHHCGSQGKY